MRIASYSVNGEDAYGMVTEKGLIRLGGASDQSAPDLKSALSQGRLSGMVEKASGKVDHLLGDVVLRPVIVNPEKIICAGVNYRSHAAELNRDMPPKPSMFLRLASSIVGHLNALEMPDVSQQFDFEGELAVIIGRAGRNISQSDALDHVAGYTCFNDGSIRDYQKHSVTAGKNFPKSGALGPWMVTADEIPDPSRLVLTTRLNGEQVQHSCTDLLIYSIPEIIAFVSEFTTLEVGDIIATGTPEGVGHKRSPQLWMKRGDTIEVEISGIGILKNIVV